MGIHLAQLCTKNISARIKAKLKLRTGESTQSRALIGTRQVTVEAFVLIDDDMEMSGPAFCNLAII